MFQFNRNHLLMVYFVLSLYFYELIIKVATSGRVTPLGLGYSAFFSIPLAIGLYFVCTLFSNRARVISATIMLGLTTLGFGTQLIYFKIFRTFYSVYSATQAAQVLDFWKETLLVIWQNLHWVALLFIPPTLLHFSWKRIIIREKLSWSARAGLAGLLILTHIAGVAAVYAGERSLHSPYDLYYKSSYPVISVEKLGLITTMRLDLQRTFLGWSPVVAPPYIPPPGDNGDNPPPPEDPIEYNVMEIDFQKLIAEETDDLLLEMHRYFSAVPATEKNENTGIFEGYNLILITAEAFSLYAVREDITPTLYKMVNQGFNFTNFYTPIWGVSTSDGEYVACTGLIPKSGIWSFRRSGANYMPFAMGNQLKSLGYKTVAYHNHTHSYYHRHISHPNIGYVYKGIGSGLKMKNTWPRSDLEMMQITVPEYIDSQPFHAYYMTVSGHLQYSFTGNQIAAKNRQYVRDLPYSTAVQAYLATQVELDRALEHLLAKLEEAGIADKTLIALSTDHYPYGLTDAEINELAGHEVEKHFETHRNAFILYTQGMEPVTIDKFSSSLDIIPTLSNLLGLEYDSRLLMGSDIFSDADPLVIFVDSSFITDKGRYNALTEEFFLNPGATIDEDYVERMLNIVRGKVYYSARVLETDYYQRALGD